MVSLFSHGRFVSMLMSAGLWQLIASRSTTMLLRAPSTSNTSFPSTTLPVCNLMSKLFGIHYFCTGCWTTAARTRSLSNLTTTLLAKPKGSRRGCLRGTEEWLVQVNHSGTTHAISAAGSPKSTKTLQSQVRNYFAFSCTVWLSYTRQINMVPYGLLLLTV